MKLLHFKDGATDISVNAANVAYIEGWGADQVTLHFVGGGKINVDGDIGTIRKLFEAPAA